MLFRFGLMVIIILILIRIFLNYSEETRRVYEQQSIVQTKRIVDSTLAVVFSSYAVDRRLDDLAELDGANPFRFLERYDMLPASYRGEIEHELEDSHAPGWYYLGHRGVVAYKARYSGDHLYFAIVLNYEDRNQSGRFEAGSDRFRNLRFVDMPAG